MVALMVTVVVNCVANACHCVYVMTRGYIVSENELVMTPESFQHQVRVEWMDTHRHAHVAPFCCIETLTSGAIALSVFLRVYDIVWRQPDARDDDDPRGED